MATKPQNTIPVLKDKIINVFIDLSTELEDRAFFLDPHSAYKVMDASFTVYSLYNALAPASVSVGLGVHYDDAGVPFGGWAQYYVNNVSLGNAEIEAGHRIWLPLDHDILPVGGPLLVSNWATVSQVGTGTLTVRLRPLEKAHGNASKRPSASV